MSRELSREIHGGALRRHLWRHDRLCPVKTEINTCEPRPNQPMSTTVEINDVTYDVGVPLDLKTAPTPTPLERTATSLQNLRSGLVQSESSKKLKAALTIKRTRGRKRRALVFLNAAGSSIWSS